MTHVLCLCPNRHCQTGLWFGESVDHEHARKSMRDIVASSLEAKQLTPFCSKCGAPGEDWSFEVVMPVVAAEHVEEFESTIMGGVNIEP